MVALPEHVRSVSKANGRRYFYFQKYRSTAQQWPRVRLPNDPLSEDFVKRVGLLPGLNATMGEDGAWSWGFIDVMGRKHSLPDPKDAEPFWVAVEKADKIGRQMAAGEAKTFSALILEFKASAAYQLNVDENGKKRAGIAKSTQDQYKRDLDRIEKAWADDAVASLTPVDVQKAIDAFKDTPSAGRVFRSVLSLLISWGIPRGYALTNPVEHTKPEEEDGTYEPWQPWAFEFFFENARLGLHLPVYSGLFTGQRLSDVLKMKRPVDGVNEMPLIAQKTGLVVPVQIHSEYRAIIRATGQDHEMLHLREDGEPWTYEGFKTAWQRELNRPEFKRFRDERVVFHGTRKNAVNNLLESGCSEEQVGSIVMMSPAMVRHYAKRVNQFRLARAAMKQLEDGWEAQRVHVLGKVQKHV